MNKEGSGLSGVLPNTDTVEKLMRGQKDWIVERFSATGPTPGTMYINMVIKRPVEK